jgi:hypothetical protein
MHQAYGKPIDEAYWEDNNPASMVVKDASVIKASKLQIYLDAGDMDQFWLYEGAEFLHQQLWQQKIRHEYHLIRGADHVGPALAGRIDAAIRFLFRYHTPWQVTPRMKAVDKMLDPLKARLDEKDHYNAMTETLPEHFAESVMIGLISEDGSLDLSLRLARFPQSGKAHIWLHAATGEGAWSLVDEAFELDHHNATPVTEDDATFDADRRKQRVSFASTNRNELLQGSIEADLLVTPTRHPQAGPGTVPAHIQLQFFAASPGFRSATKRWELTGRMTGVCPRFYLL